MASIEKAITTYLAPKSLQIQNYYLPVKTNLIDGIVKSKLKVLDKIEYNTLSHDEHNTNYIDHLNQIIFFEYLQNNNKNESTIIPTKYTNINKALNERYLDANQAVTLLNNQHLIKMTGIDNWAELDKLMAIHISEIEANTKTIKGSYVNKDNITNLIKDTAPSLLNISFIDKSSEYEEFINISDKIRSAFYSDNISINETLILAKEKHDYNEVIDLLLFRPDMIEEKSLEKCASYFKVIMENNVGKNILENHEQLPLLKKELIKKLDKDEMYAEDVISLFKDIGLGIPELMEDYLVKRIEKLTNTINQLTNRKKPKQ